MQKSILEEGFLDYFNGLEDPRGTRNRLYTMAEILLTTHIPHQSASFFGFKHEGINLKSIGTP